VIRRQQVDDRAGVARPHPGERQEHAGPGLPVDRLADDGAGVSGELRQRPALVRRRDDGDRVCLGDQPARPIERVLQHRSGAGERAVLLRSGLAESALDVRLQSETVAAREDDRPAPRIRRKP